MFEFNRAGEKNLDPSDRYSEVLKSKFSTLSDRIEFELKEGTSDVYQVLIAISDGKNNQEGRQGIKWEQENLFLKGILQSGRSSSDKPEMDLPVKGLLSLVSTYIKGVPSKLIEGLKKDSSYSSEKSTVKASEVESIVGFLYKMMRF